MKKSKVYEKLSDLESKQNAKLKPDQKHVDEGRLRSIHKDPFKESIRLNSQEINILNDGISELNNADKNSLAFDELPHGCGNISESKLLMNIDSRREKIIYEIALLPVWAYFFLILFAIFSSQLGYNEPPSTEFYKFYFGIAFGLAVIARITAFFVQDYLVLDRSEKVIYFCKNSENPFSPSGNIYLDFKHIKYIAIDFISSNPWLENDSDKYAVVAVNNYNKIYYLTCWDDDFEVLVNFATSIASIIGAKFVELPEEMGKFYMEGSRPIYKISLRSFTQKYSWITFVSLGILIYIDEYFGFGIF